MTDSCTILSAQFCLLCLLSFPVKRPVSYPSSGENLMISQRYHDRVLCVSSEVLVFFKDNQYIFVMNKWYKILTLFPWNMRHELRLQLPYLHIANQEGSREMKVLCLSASCRLHYANNDLHRFRFQAIQTKGYLQIKWWCKSSKLSPWARLVLTGLSFPLGLPNHHAYARSYRKMLSQHQINSFGRNESGTEEIIVIICSHFRTRSAVAE